MIGRFLAVCGWLARQVGRPAGGRVRPAGTRNVLVLAVAGVLCVLATLPILVPQLDPQPQDVIVQQIFDRAVEEPGTWVRIRGRLYRLAEPPTAEPGAYGLLVDAQRALRAIVVRAPSSEALEADPEEVVVEAHTGRLAAAPIIVDEDLPIQATEAGTPPRVVSDRILVLDAVPKPARQVWWPLAIPPLLLAGMLLIGSRAGYPVFRAGKVVDVLAAPLGVGERLPAAYGGRVGPNERDLADPGAALLLVRRGPKGNLLTAQPLPDDGGLAPAPVTIGGGWTAGRIGEVHTVRETVPALVIRSELVQATFLFARTAERDRVAALIAVDR